MEITILIFLQITANYLHIHSFIHSHYFKCILFEPLREIEISIHCCSTKVSSVEEHKIIIINCMWEWTWFLLPLEWVTNVMESVYPGLHISWYAFLCTNSNQQFNAPVVFNRHKIIFVTKEISLFLKISISYKKLYLISIVCYFRIPLNRNRFTWDNFTLHLVSPVPALSKNFFTQTSY